MPPVRTSKQNTCSAQSPVALPPHRILKPVCKGRRDARFSSSEYDWAGKYEQEIGTATRNIFFGSRFVLNDDHIEDILTLGSLVSRNLTQFIFIYEDVTYGAQNDARCLTDKSVVRLAEACPNLTEIHLPGTSLITDDGLLSLFENCSGLTSVELTGTSRGSWHGLTGKALIALRENPHWAPNLKKLVLGETEDNKMFMKERHEVKKWGDWELEETKTYYKKGRLQSIW